MTEPNSTLTYTRYLGLTQILTAQRPKSDQHDEMLFIVSHQIYELWFKQLLHELGHLQVRLESGDTPKVVRTLRRILLIIKIANAQLTVLETMTPGQFISFRDHLEASSGFESAQFRELEAVLGRRDVQVVRRYPEGSVERRRIADAMARPSLFDSFVRYLGSCGYGIPAEYGERDTREPIQPCTALRDILVRVYHDDAGPAGVCELLVDLDEGVQEWRYRHAKMVERVIGNKRGTAGSSGAAYLRTTVGKPAFPDLWAVRDQL